MQRSASQKREELTAQEKSLPPIAAYTLLFLTTVCIAAAFWLALSQGGAAVVRPAATVVIAGLAGGLVCVSTRDTRSFDEGQWVLAVYSWLLTAFAGAATSLGVFILASVAFLSSAGNFAYTGLGLFGVITGYLGASLAMTGALSWGPSMKSPLDRVNREINLQMERILPSLQPRVSRLMEEVILGPPIPPYNGYVAVTYDLYSGYAGAAAVAGVQPCVSFTVWFDTVRPDTNPLSNPQLSQSPRKIYPVIVRGQGSLAGNLNKADQEQVIQFDVLLHIATVAASPIRSPISVPLSGRSEPLSFFVPSADLPGGAIPSDALLEVRCRGALIQIFDLHGLDGSVNA